MPLDYQIPQNALPAVERMIGEIAEPEATILDVCCSYGFDGGLFTCDTTLAELAGRCAEAERLGLSSTELRTRERAFVRDRRKHPQRRVLGLDASEAAIDYACATELLEDGWAEDLESAPPSAELAEAIADVDLIVCTGGVGYVGRRTFARLARAHRRPDRLRVVSFVLRMYDYAPIADTLGEHGLVTERWAGHTVRQRRFADAEEQDGCLSAVRARGLDPAGMEAAGWYYADCFVSRPATSED